MNPKISIITAGDVCFIIDTDCRDSVLYYITSKQLGLPANLYYTTNRRATVAVF